MVGKFLPDCRASHFTGCTTQNGTHKVVITLYVLQSAAEIVKHFKILVTCFSARVSRSAGV